MSQIEVFIVAAARIAIGSFGGALKDVPFADLASTALRAAPDQVGHVVMGTVIPTEPCDARHRRRRC